MDEEAGHLNDDNGDDADKEDDDDGDKEEDVDDSPNASTALAPGRFCAVVFKHIVPNCQAH